MKCSYCGKEGIKLKKVGPNLRFCNDECYLKDCIERHPGTSLADMAMKMLEVKKSGNRRNL